MRGFPPKPSREAAPRLPVQPPKQYPSLFPVLPPATRAALDSLPALISETFPLSRKFRSGLPRDIAELSRLLTSERPSRTLSYLNRPALLSAYLRYFLPWNVHHLARLLPLLPLTLAPGDAVTDLGSGPLTFAVSLWLSRPDLRALELEFRCIDRTAAVLEAGERLFAVLTKGQSPWIIKTIKGNIDAPVFGKKAALVVAVNVFNEVFEGEAHDSFLDFTENAAQLLLNLVPPRSGAIAPGALAAAPPRSGAAVPGALEAPPQVFIAEPGVPKSGRFIAALRASLMQNGFAPLAPCPHNRACPLPCPSGSRREKWCHFAFNTLDAPESLRALSAEADLPKERASMSFLLAGARPKLESGRPRLESAGKQGVIKPEMTIIGGAYPAARIVSDSFPVPGGFGRYGCSERGLVLLSGNKPTIEGAVSGTLVPVVPGKDAERDKKSGALVVTEAKET